MSVNCNSHYSKEHVRWSSIYKVDVVNACVSCLYIYITRVKRFYCKKKPLHVGKEVKKAQKQGRDYTTHKKTNLIYTKEYPIHLFHTLNSELF